MLFRNCSLCDNLVFVGVVLPKFTRNIRQTRFHHGSRCGISSQIPPVKVRQNIGSQVIHQPFIRHPVYCLSVQRQQVFMFRHLCQRLIDNIPNTVLVQCIVDIKLYSSVSYYPPMLLLILVQSGSVLPVVPACVTTITQPGGNEGEVSTSPTL